MRPRRLAAALLALTTAAGCTPAPTEPPEITPSHTPDAGDPVVVATTALPTSFDPLDTDDPYTTRIAGLVQRGLFRYDAKGKAVPEVATSVKTTDNRVYTVTIDPGWTFSDGEPVTADSFVDAWSRAADPSRPTRRRELFSPIDGFVASKDLARHSPAPRTALPTGRSPRLRGLTVLDRTTFTITLTAPHVGFEQRLGHVAFAPLPDVAYTDPRGFRSTPVGNGPYRFDGPWNANGPVRLRPSQSYPGTDTARNSGLVFRPYGDPQRALRDVREGELDVLDVLPTDDLATYRTTFGERAVNQPVGQVVGLVFPVRRDPWTGADGAARRKAVSLAVDREAIVRDLYAGTRTPATDLAAPVVEGHSRDLCGEACTLDPDAALATLDEARGLPGGLTVAYVEDLAQGPLASAVCSGVTKRLAMPCTTHPYPDSEALRAAVATGKETGPRLESRIMEYPQLESFLVPRYLPGAAGNDSGFDDPSIGTALTRAGATTDPAEAVARYRTAEQKILTTLPVVPLLAVHATTVSSESVADVRVDVFGSPAYTQITRPVSP